MKTDTLLSSGSSRVETSVAVNTDVIVAHPSYTELSDGPGVVDSTPATVTSVTVTLAAPVLAENIGNVPVIISG